MKALFKHVWMVKNDKATCFQQYVNTKQEADAMN